MFGANLYEFNQWTEDGYGSEIKYLFLRSCIELMPNDKRLHGRV